MASDAFPPTFVCSWSSANPVEEINGLINRLELLSYGHSLQWEIFITLKFRSQKKKKQLGSLLTSSNVRGIANIPNRTSDTDDADSVSALYFVRFNDIELCCVLPKSFSALPAGTSGIEIIPMSDGCEEKWLITSFPKTIRATNNSSSNSSSSSRSNGGGGSGGVADAWTTRTIWRASGQKFCFGDYIICVGFLEHTGAPARPVIEAMYCPVSLEADSTQRSLEATAGTGAGGGAGAAPPCIQSKLQKVVADLLYAVHPDTVQMSPFLHHSNNGSKNNSGEVAGSVESRALQWVSIL